MYVAKKWPLTLLYLISVSFLLSFPVLRGQEVARNFLSAHERDLTESFSSVDCKSRSAESSVIPPDFSSVLSFSTAWR